MADDRPQEETITRYVVCLDGTWNNAVSEVERLDGSRVYRPTNVLKIARATRSCDGRGVKQVTYYDTGVGSMNRAPTGAARLIRRLDNALGGMLGVGFETNVEEAYSFLANNWQEGDELFVFGFSRGAAQARSLVRLIECIGGFPAKQDAYYVPKLFTEYLDSCGTNSAADFWDRQNERNKLRGRPELAAIVPARVRYLGVWDTVLSLGTRLRPFWKAVPETIGFHVPAKPPAIVDRIRHAMAIDERRHDFQVEIFAGDHPDLEQRWFAGVHSNVGGGLTDDGLANSALHWLLDEARALGLVVEDDYLKHFRAYFGGRASAKSLGFRVVDTLLRPLRGFKGERNLLQTPGLTVDESVLSRLRADPAKHQHMAGRYRPKNLLRYLAAHPELNDQLDEQTRALVSPC